MKSADAIAGAITALTIRRAAMDLLARREHSFCELDTKLARRFGAHPLIHTEIERLRDERLQSDARFAEAYLHARAQRCYGPLRIAAELRERGVGDAIIEATLRATAIDWLANLEKLLSSKFGDAPAADFKEKAKRMRFLQYRGFAVDAINEVVT